LFNFCKILLREKLNLFLIKLLILLAHLFVKLPRPGDSEVTFSVFDSNCHLLLTI